MRILVCVCPASYGHNASTRAGEAASPTKFSTLLVCVLAVMGSGCVHRLAPATAPATASVTPLVPLPQMPQRLPGELALSGPAAVLGDAELPNARRALAAPASPAASTLSVA